VAGAVKVFKGKISGAKSDRTQLRKAIGALAKGDALIVTRLDRLAGSTRDLLNILATITDKRAGFKSLGDEWADTTTPHGRLVLTVLGGLAEFERELIRARTSEGRARAVKNGVKPIIARSSLKRTPRGAPTESSDDIAQIGHAPAAIITASFDHLVGASEERGR
jgi:DNA invertase Pin-like site-specific DNA recombinase